MDLLKGAYSLVIMTEDELVGVRIPGLRPMFRQLESHVLASESCTINAMNADFIRDIDPGNSDYYKEQGKLLPQKQRASCIFEYVYFARPDSTIDGANV